MKKSLVFLSLLTALSTVSCGGEEIDTSPIALDFGYIYKNGVYDLNQISVSYADLLDIVDREESFVLLIYHDPICTCWTNFYPIAMQFMNEYNVKLYAFDNAELAGHKEKFGIYESTGSALPGICFFRRGRLLRQTIYGRIRSGPDRFIFTDYSRFKEYMLENIYLPNMYYLDKESLDYKINNNEEFNLYVGRVSCGDCKFVNKNYLYSWSESNKENRLEDPIYVFDLDPYRGTSSYQDIKNEYGLSVAGNATFGYDYGEDHGMVPTFQRWKQGAIFDMITILNDKLEENNILYSYFTEARIAASPMLRNTGNVYLLNGRTVEEKDIGKYQVPGTEIIYKYIYQESQFSWHKPILELYISNYVK